MDSDEELLCHVDERDRVIGSCRRGDAHRLGLLHRAVHVLVLNGAGEVYLQKRSRTKDCSPGLWDSSAAGHVDCGETYEACALRELAEELGIQPVATPQALFTLEACAENGWEFIRVYPLRWDGPMRPNPLEIEQGLWVPAFELDARVALDELALTASFKSIWRRFRALPPVPQISPQASEDLTLKAYPVT
jgi:isopentenyldiphosphate isomerase